MKNKFGFIPIVLPVLVMVLIIGLINLGGPQSAQAQESVTDESARLTDLTLTLTTEDIAVTLTQKSSGATGFKSDVGRYTAVVDSTVGEVTVLGTPPDDPAHTVSYAASGATTGDVANIAILNTGLTKITITSDADAADDDGMAVYVIELTKRVADVHTNGPRLSTLALEGEGIDEVSFDRKYGDKTGFHPAIADYEVSVVYSVQSVKVTLGNGEGVTSTITPVASNLVTDAEADDHRVALNEGVNTIYVRTMSDGGRDMYTVKVTRRSAELAAANGLQLFQASNTTSVDESTNLVTGYHRDESNIAVSVPFGIDLVGLVVAPATDVIVSKVTPTDSAPTEDTNAVGIAEGISVSDSYTVALSDVSPTAIRVTVQHGVVNERVATTRNTSTRTYALTVTREAPKLGDSVDDAAIGDGLRLQYDAMVPPDANDGGATGGFGLNPAYDPNVMAYKASVPYMHEFVTIIPTAADVDMTKVGLTGRNSQDARPGITGYQVELTPGVRKVVTVRVESKTTASVRTDYTIALTRDRTPLNSITLMTDTRVPLMDVNDAVYEAEADDTMPIATTTWTGKVGYRYTLVTVGAASDSDVAIELKNGGEVVATTIPPNPLNATTTLMVGMNNLAIKASAAGNEQTYSLTVEREGPKPTLQFTLLNSDDGLISSGNHQLKLGPQSRTYDLAEHVDGITSDDLLVASSIQMRVIPLPNLMGDIEMDHTGVKVSINGVTVPEDASQHISVDLSEGANTLVFDVNYETGDTSDPMDISTHRVLIERRGNSVPRFPTNHSLHGKEIVVVKNTVITPTYELPFANGGNGDLMYKLEGDEARGTARTLPTSLYTLPRGEGSDGMNGRLNTAPDLTSEGDVSYYYLVLSVSDSDAITGSSDEGTLRFTIKVVRDPKQVPPTTTTPRAKGDLIDLRVLRVNTNERYDLTPDPFIGTTYSYTVELPTDIDTADVQAVAATGAMVTLEGTHTSMRAAEGEGIRHEWNAFQIYRGGAATVRNVYDVVVTEDGTSKTYRLTVTRKADIPPTFLNNSKITREYYDDIFVSDLSKEKSELPVAVKDSGNGALMYSFTRRADNLPAVVPKDFLGLLVPDLMDMPKLTGKPNVDGSVSTRHADRSEVLASYTVIDSDDNTAESDSDSIDVDIIVYRNVALQSYTVDGVRKSDLDTSTREYRSTRAYRYDDTDIKEYTSNVSHSVSMVTFEAEAYDTARASVSVLPADADTSKGGHQINVGSGDNEVTVTVSNGGAISAVHVINLRKPGLQLLDVTVTEDEDARSGGSLTADVPLTPMFDRETLSYTASVETWVRSVQVMATPSDPSATVFVNDFEVADPPGYSVIDLDVGENPITLGASINQQVADSQYMIMLTREEDMAPSFGTAMFADITRITRIVDSPVEAHPCAAIELPKAMKDSGNGDLTYAVNMEQLPPGLDFDAATRMITGTPMLDEGYSSDFDIVYTVSDEDGNTAASDTDSIEFTITITHDPDAACTATPPDAVARPNQLSELVVTYDRGGVMGKFAGLMPEFMSDNSGPYTAEIPTDATNVQVTAVRAAPAAVISMNDVRIDSGQKIVLPPVATIEVRHSGHPEMTYTLNTNRVANTDPVFSGSVEDMTFVSGQVIEDPVGLPAATGGNGTLMYSLVDHEGNIPDGLVFTAATRMLSGTPTLVRDADDTMYRMTYTATDENGDTDTRNFNIRVCDASVQGCVETAPEPNPGYTPMGLEVSRSGGSATITWRPGDDAMKQFVAALILNPTTGTMLSTIRPAPAGAEVTGDVSSYTFTGLLDASVGTYIYGVWGYDGDNMWKDANGNAYLGYAMDQ